MAVGGGGGGCCCWEPVLVPGWGACCCWPVGAAFPEVAPDIEVWGFGLEADLYRWNAGPEKSTFIHCRTRVLYRWVALGKLFQGLGL